MNELGIRLAWTTGQATVLVVLAALLSAWAAWRRPEAGANAALAGLAGLLGISILAWIPLPAWWTWQAHAFGEAVTASNGTDSESSTRQANVSKAGDMDKAHSEAGTKPAQSGWSLASLFSAWRKYRSGWTSRIAYHPLGTIVAVGLVSAAALGLLRLAIGIWTVHRCRRRSRPIDDSNLGQLLDGLCRGMGCTQAVQLGESADLGGPATVGWRRPLLLLPPEWRTWTDDERRAVLAHELAHICRRDSLGWLVARLAVALHFYHPLVHGLARRLHLQQELAADALGARHAGGRALYLRALAKLALQQETQFPWKPAWAFLPVRGTLMRRIAMLRTEEKPSKGRRLGVVVPVLLGLLALGVSALRGPAQDESAASLPESIKREVPATKKDDFPSKDRAPFAYWHHPPEGIGYIAIRPSAVFTDPSMKKQAGLFNQQIAAGLAQLGLPETFLHIEEIDQISGGVFFQYDEKAPEGRAHALMFSLSVLRTTHDFDWTKVIDAIARKRAKATIDGHPCYKIMLEDLKSPVLVALLGAYQGKPGEARAEKATYFHLPDNRTIITGSKEQLQQLFAREGRQLGGASTAAWRQAERGLLLLVFDNPAHPFAKQLRDLPEKDRKQMPGFRDVQVIAEQTDSVVIGVDFANELRVDAYASCPNERQAKAVVNALLGLQKTAQVVVAAEPKETSDMPFPSWVRKLCKQATVSLEGAMNSEATVAHLHSQVQTTFAEILESMGDLNAEVESPKPPKP